MKLHETKLCMGEYRDSFLFILGELWMGYLKKKKYELEEGIDVDFFVLLLCPG